MLKQLRLALLMTLTLTAALPMVAQVRHVTTVNPSTKQSYMEVYEFEYVDIQPQFPGGERGLINFINKTREKQVRGDILLVFLSKKMKAIDKKLKKIFKFDLKKVLLVRK